MAIAYNIKKCLYKRGKIYWVKWYQDGRARYKSTQMTNKELAEETAEEIILEHLKEKGIPAGDILFTDLIDKLENVLEEEVQTNVIAENTNKFYRMFLENIRGIFGHYQISQITVEDVELYLKKRRKTNGLSISTMRHEHLAWSKLFQFAVERGYCNDNIINKVSKAKYRTKGKNDYKPYILSEQQVQKLLKVATPYTRNIVQFLYNTGLRRGELENLRFSDIDMDKGIIYIRKHDDGWRPKGGKDRTVPINDIVGKILQDKISQQQTGQKYVFISSTGGKAYHYHKSFTNLLKKTRIDKLMPEESGKGVHLLRHSFCSYLVNEAKVPLPVAQEIMGHQDIKTTMMYVHTDERQKQLAIRKFDYIRVFQKLRSEGKSIDEVLKLIADKFEVPLHEVEDILIGVK